MTASPITFAPQPSGRVLAMLGARAVGEITPSQFAGRGRVVVHWRCGLPMADGAGPTGMPRPATSVEAAQRALTSAIEEWFTGAGPLCEELVRQIRRAG